MGERKTWTTQEDHILRQLYEQKGIKKWSAISKLMETQYQIEGRNGKQCRERYHNHLKNGIRKQKWTKEEEKLLVQLHSIHGNRWAYISKLIYGRTQNCVKNMLYSKLRKAVRQLNRFTYLYYRKTLKEIKISFINRLIQFTETAHKKTEQERTHPQNTSIFLKNQILLQDTQDLYQLTEAQKERVKTLIEQILLFKRQNQKYCRGNTLAKLKKLKLRNKDQTLDIHDEQIIQCPQHPTIVSTERTYKNRKHKINYPINSKQDICDELFPPKIAQNSAVVSPTTEQATCSTPNEVSTLRNRVSVIHMDSLQNNFQNLLVDAGLEMPIQIQSYIQNLTPTPSHNGMINLDWTLATNGWKLSNCD